MVGAESPSHGFELVDQPRFGLTSCTKGLRCSLVSTRLDSAEVHDGVVRTQPHEFGPIFGPNNWRRNECAIGSEH